MNTIDIYRFYTIDTIYHKPWLLTTDINHKP